MSYLKRMMNNPHCFGSNHRIVIGDDSKCNDGKGCGALEQCINGKCVDMPMGRRASPNMMMRKRLNPLQRKLQANTFKAKRNRR